MWTTPDAPFCLPWCSPLPWPLQTGSTTPPGEEQVLEQRRVQSLQSDQGWRSAAACFLPVGWHCTALLLASCCMPLPQKVPPADTQRICYNAGGTSPTT